MVNVWTVQTRPSEDDQWRDHLVTYRFVDAIHTYQDLPDPKRFLRNGRVFRMKSTDEQLDLAHEEEE